MMNEKIKEKRVTFLEKFAYGMGGFGGNTSVMLITSFFVYYCTDSLGLTAGIIGTLLMVAKCLDGVSDIIMGYIINHTRSRFGKARIWVLICAFPCGLTTFLLFWVPSFFSATASYAYIFIVYVLQNAVFYTMYTVATQSLISFAAKNPNDRYAMQTFHTFLGILPAIILSFIGQSMAAAIGWTATALICGVMAFLTILFAGLMVKEIPEEQLKDEFVEDAGSVGFAESVKVLLVNKYFWILLGIYFSIYGMSGIQGTAAVYYCNYILQNESAFGWMYLAMYSPLLLFIGFLPKLVEKYGARRTNVVGAIFSILAGLIAFFNPYSMAVVVAALFMVTIGGLPGYITLTPLVAEIAENIKLRTGKDITAMCYSCSSVGIKMGTGLGTAAAGILLTATGYDGLAEVQSVGALNGIKLMFILSPVIAYIIMAVLYQILDVAEVNVRLKESRQN